MRSTPSIRRGRPRARTITRARGLLYALATAYLVGIWVYGVGCTAQYRVVPGDISNYLEVAALFPQAARAVTEYRVEGWVCQDKVWEEVDYRAHFGLHAGDKENILQRAVALYHDDSVAMADLDAYVVERHNASRYADDWTSDGTGAGRRIGGVRFVRVGTPIPKPGEALERFHHKTLAAYPKSSRRTVYGTPWSTIEARCEAPDLQTARAQLEALTEIDDDHAL